jgi:hypothetical protein
VLYELIKLHKASALPTNPIRPITNFPPLTRPRSTLPCPAGRSVPGRGGPERRRRPRPTGPNELLRRLQRLGPGQWSPRTDLALRSRTSQRRQAIRGRTHRPCHQRAIRSSQCRFPADNAGQCHGRLNLHHSLPPSMSLHVLRHNPPASASTLKAAQFSGREITEVVNCGADQRSSGEEACHGEIATRNPVASSSTDAT